MSFNLAVLFESFDEVSITMDIYFDFFIELLFWTAAIGVFLGENDEFVSLLLLTDSS